MTDDITNDPKDGGEARVLSEVQQRRYNATQNQVNPYELGTHKPEPWDTVCQWCDQPRRVLHEGESMPGAPTRRTLVCDNCDGRPAIFDANEIPNIIKGTE